MFKKIIAVALFLTVVPLGVYAAETDKVAPPSVKSQTAPSSGRSYFQGVWVGSFTGWADSSIRQAIRIGIGKEIRDKVFDVTYSWDAVEMKKGPVPAGKAKAEGTEKGDKFVFQYETKQGRKTEITLQKDKENVVKMRLEKLGPLDPKERPYSETTLNRE